SCLNLAARIRRRNHVGGLLCRLDHRLPQPRPDRLREPQEVLALNGPSRQELPSGAPALLHVAAPAAGDDVAVRVVAALHLRLHVIQRELRGRQHRAAVDAAVRVPPQDPGATAPPPRAVPTGHAHGTRRTLGCSRAAGSLPRRALGASLRVWQSTTPAWRCCVARWNGPPRRASLARRAPSRPPSRSSCDPGSPSSCSSSSAPNTSPTRGPATSRCPAAAAIPRMRTCSPPRCARPP